MRGFHDQLRRRPSSLFMLFGCSSISMASLIIWSMYLDLVDRMVVSWSWMRLSGDPLARPRGALKGPFPLTTLLLSFSLLDKLWHTPLSFWLLGLTRSWPYSPLVWWRFLPWLTGSYISNWFHTRDLLIALMMEAARTSETLVNFYHTTRRYNPEDTHLCII
jgi:hypothetical protein